MADRAGQVLRPPVRVHPAARPQALQDVLQELHRPAKSIFLSGMENILQQINLDIFLSVSRNFLEGCFGIQVTVHIT